MTSVPRLAILTTFALLILLNAPAAAPGAELGGLVPNRYEQAAVEKGRKLGIGAARLEGPEVVEVSSMQTWTFVYTAGPAGVQPGGGLRIGMRHLSQWSPPQTADPRSVGYLTVQTEHAQPVKTLIDVRSRFFPQYFAWHNMLQVTLPERGLQPGETLRLTYGDRGGGSPGIKVQPFDESCFVFKTYVDALGQGDYLPLGDSPAIEIVSAEPFRISVVMPSDAVAGEPTWVIVRAEDLYGNPADRYRGTVALKSTDRQAQLPQAHTFTAEDRGVFRFQNIIFRSVDVQVVSASDGAFSQRGNPVRVVDQRPEELLLWGDLHGHTLVSDGRGTVEEFYDFADRVAGLDVCAVTDHAFEILDEMWAHSKQVTNRAYDPGRFVTLQAFEWSGMTPVGGDHNCYFLDDDPPLFRSTSYYDPTNLQEYHGPDPKQEHVRDVFAELQQLLDDKNVFCIPHFGGRRANPEFHQPDVQRMVEIYSEHKRSEDWANTFLARGQRLGIMASTDGHYGNPGYGYLRPSFQWDTQEIGMAAVAIRAPERTRESVFRSLYDRRVYATSGDRIILDFDVDGHPMGTEFRTSSAPLVHIEAHGTAPIERVEIKKNGRIVHLLEPGEMSVRAMWRDPEFDPTTTSYYYVRIVQLNNEEAISSPVWVN